MLNTLFSFHADLPGNELARTFEKKRQGLDFALASARAAVAPAWGNLKRTIVATILVTVFVTTLALGAEPKAQAVEGKNAQTLP